MHCVAQTIAWLAAALMLVQIATAFTIPAEDDDGGKHWVLLVAGSNEYYNYRHQADICHAYQIMSKNGIPDQQIVVMMYDDIAWNPRNPTQGVIINRPNGTNVYPGVPKDYTKHDVKPEVFLSVLTGDAEEVKRLTGREGKVINSGPKDRVFVYFADHGAPGILGFPEDMLHAEDLHKAIMKMHNKRKYKQMVFYIEACESGSIFDKSLPSDINVYATTAANPDESSYACYLDTVRQTYLGDCYSVAWMQDSDKENLRQETLHKQYELVKVRTNESHVMEYGDKTMGKLKVADFQGTYNSDTLRFTSESEEAPVSDDAVPSEQVAMETLKRVIAISSGAQKESAMRELEELERRKTDSEAFFTKVFHILGDETMLEYFLQLPVQFSDFKCYRESLRLITDLCPKMKLPQNDFALRKLRSLANLCETDIAPEKIWRAIAKVAPTAEICA